MSERTYNYHYRPLPLVQRDGYSSLGRAAYPRERVRASAAASDDESMYSASEGSYRRRQSEFRMVEGTRDASRASTRSERRASRGYEDDESPERRTRGRSSSRSATDASRAQGRSVRSRSTRRGEGSRTGSGSSLRMSRFGFAAQDDFDDYYADFDDYDAPEDDYYDGYADYDDYDAGYDGYDVPAGGYATAAGRRDGSFAHRRSGVGARGTDEWGEPYEEGRDTARRRREGHGSSSGRRAAPRSRSFSLLSLVALPFVGLRDFVLYHMRFWGFVLAVALTVAMLFAPVRNLYIAHRQLADLQATYDALEAENQAILNEIEVLQTREGIENEARERGYVSEGETKVVVEGLPELEGESDATSASADEATDKRRWYIRFFDMVFGYEAGE